MITIGVVSFPHYFLQATGHLSEQLKTREWIVARITSIAEQVVNHNVNISCQGTVVIEANSRVRTL